MSYLVLARKYRPRSFEELVGQEHVVQALSNALTQQRLHHAYLFTGTRGVGKTTVSRILAKSLNCVGPDGNGGITAIPCGVCHVCRDIDSGRFVDYVELDAASNRGVEEITQLLDQAVYKPVVGRFKVYMVDEVHMLSSHAFNAMLKTLEEPPEYLKFVLATTDPQKVPATVLSRCLQFNLRPISPPTVQHHLADVLAREHIEAEPGALRLLSRGARGSMRDALSLTDQAIAFGAGRLEEAGVRQMLGAVDRSHVVRIVRALVDRDGAALIRAVDGLRTLGLSALGTLDELAALLQQMAVLQAVPEAADADDPDAAVTAKLAALMRADEVQLVYSIVLHGRAELGLAPDEYSGLVMILLRMLAFQSTGTGPAAPPPTSGSAGGVKSGARGGIATATVVAASAATAASATPPAPDATATADAVQARAATAPAASTRQTTTPVTEAALRPVAPPPVARPSAPATDTAPAAPGRAAAAGVGADVRDGGPASARSRAAVPAPSEAMDDMPEPPPWDEAPGGQESAPEAMSNAAASSRPGASAAATAPAAALPSASTKPFSIPRAASPAPPPARPTTAAPLVTTPLGDRWTHHVRSMVEAGAIGAMARELALQAQCLSVEPHADGPPNGELWRLKVERETLRAGAHCEKLQAALTALLGFPVKLLVESGVTDDSPARRDAAEKARRQSEAEDTIQNDPLVLTLMQQYRTARIVPGSIKFH